MKGQITSDSSGQERKKIKQNRGHGGGPPAGRQARQMGEGSCNHTPCLADCEVLHGVIIKE